jgi:hypothetical protein
VAVVVWLLGSAQGEPELIAAIHGPRLERLMERLVDTPVRGFAYEAAGRVPQVHLRAGRQVVERAAETWRIPVAILDGNRERAGWADATAAAIRAIL